MKHHIVVLDDWVKPPPLDFDPSISQFKSTTVDQLPERMKDATIVITSSTKVTREGIEAAPHLQLIACNSVGTDNVDKDAVIERGITLCNVRAQNTISVSEHAFALYYALRRKIVPLHHLTLEGIVWPRESVITPHLGRPPRTNGEETLVVIGHGALGQNVEKIAGALGMRVLIAERKGAAEVREGRTDFQHTLTQGTIFILVAPLDSSTRGMISTEELEAMDSTALVINVGRGGIIDEHALAKALKDGQIGGAATDVFEHEPATKENCPLLDSTIPNLVLSPHIAWYSSRTINGVFAMVKANLEGFVAGKPINVVIPAT